MSYLAGVGAVALMALSAKDFLRNQRNHVTRVRRDHLERCGFWRSIPKCGLCGKPIGKSPWTGAWQHYTYDDYMGPCYWGKPGKPDSERIGGEQ